MVNYVGNGFLWWFGVAEDVDDPFGIGRVRVRIVGHHSDDLNDLPTEDLPWAQPILPITSGGISGIGRSPTGIKPGTIVFGFFGDGSERQLPIMLGVMPTIRTSTRTGAFSDPSHTYPVVPRLDDKTAIPKDVSMRPKQESVIADTQIRAASSKFATEVATAVAEKYAGMQAGIDEIRDLLAKAKDDSENAASYIDEIVAKAQNVSDLKESLANDLAAVTVAGTGMTALLKAVI